jgi:peptidoglycan/LPS O-acetylase OafA/YrhL
MTEYRADIDGLRAIAIVPVLLFHAGFAFCPGGYVGVDVFFVVSGFLITSLIAPDISAGRFSLIDFYSRRMRRLFPALFAVVIASAVAGAWLLMPRAYQYFGGSAFATALFGSNIFFWLEAGYFDTAAKTKPLLHTWSLAVEEQFYLMFPLLLGLALRGGSTRRAVAWTVGVLAASLLASQWAVRQAPPAAFYLVPFRAWELALGVLLALTSVAPPRSATLRNALASAGLAAIAWSSATYSWQTEFPGFSALVPCLGAALVIWNGQDRGTLVNRWLAWRPLVFIGLISYSLYLWHWPLLVFTRLYLVRVLTTPDKIVVLAAAFALAIASWCFIEQPIRRRARLSSDRALLMWAAITVAAVSAVGLGLVVSSGWPQRLDARASQLLAGASDVNPRRDECSFLEGSDLLAGKACRLGPPAGVDRPPRFVVWGDSHADALMPVFDRLALQHGTSGLYAGRLGCPPLLGVERRDIVVRCREYNDAVLQTIERLDVPRIIIVARWAHYTSDPTYKREARTRVVITDDESRTSAMAGNDVVLERGLARTLAALGGREVVVVAPIPEVGYNVPDVLARLAMLGREFDLRPTTAEFAERQQYVEAMLGRLRSRYAFELTEPAVALCTGERCAVLDQDVPLYSDDHHLTTSGAMRLLRLLDRAVPDPGGA